jgi:nitroreductase
MSNAIAFNRPVADLVRRRQSCRSFAAVPIEPGVLAGLEGFAAAVRTPFPGEPRFGIIDNERVRAENLFSAGSYGLIKGARFYLAALVRKDEPRRWENAGFALEAAVLRATDLELGSCWIGGIFDRKRFGRLLAIGADEQLPAVVAVGHPAQRRSLRDRLVRWSAGGDRRLPATDLFFDGAWSAPLALAGAGPWAPVLECVRLAPSASNKQPWRVVRAGKACHFFLDRDKAYAAMMPMADLQRIDLGIAMCHFELAAAEFGLNGEWQTSEPQLPDTPANFEYIASFLGGSNELT